MATNFESAAYRAGLQALLNRHGVGVTVEAFNAKRDYEKFEGGPVAELEVEGFQCSQSGAPRTLDGLLTAGLLVMRKLNEDEAEEQAFELAIDVATALVDECPDGAPPVFPAGIILVTGIEPDAPDGALQHRVVAYRVTFEQAWHFQRTNTIAEPGPLNTLYVGRAPDIGAEHEADYRKLLEL